MPPRSIHHRAQDRITISKDDGALAAAKFSNALSKLINDLSKKEVSDDKRSAIENYFWLIEEYKISVFAQELKTSVKVSNKILEKEFDKIRRMI